MSFLDKISYWGVRCLVNPFYTLKPIHFQSRLKNARSVLIFFDKNIPEIYDIPEITDLLNIFNGKKIRIIDFGTQTDDKKISFPVTYLALKHINLWQLIRSTQLQWLSSETYDVYIDLAPSYTPSIAFLGYKIQSPLKIAFRRQNADNCFHLQYQPSENTSYAGQIKGFTEFIRNINL